MVDLKPIPLAHGHRVHTCTLPGAALGVGPLGAFAGYALVAVMNEGGCFFRFALLRGNAREGWAWGADAALPGAWGAGEELDRDAV
ncbi:MAG: hypothetical protein N2Z75_04480 [Meiothermus sp.]|nr:hypothetical protein [Meiothermus sp.]